ncbi:MAG: TolC family protein [Bacteroidales bacterium]|jgi:outer membrane protein TolC|nr:TolC family protein [Bacteroidales bacterium]
MNYKIFIVGALFLGFSFTAKTQENTYTVSMKEAQEYALDRNKQLQNVRNDVQIAAEQFKQARGQGLPQINGSLDYMTNFNYEAMLNFGGGGESTPPDINYGLLDPGDLEILKLLQKMNAPSATSIKMTDQSNAQIQVSQLIFGGQYWIGLETAKIAQILAQQNVKLTELDVLENVANTYQLILATEDIMKVIDRNISNLEDIKQHTQNMYAAGMAEQTDVDQISISLSGLKNQQNAMQRSISLNYNMLRYQMGIDFDKEIVLSDSLNTIMTALETSTGLTMEFNIAQNPSYQIIETQVEMQEKMINMEKWAYAPTLTGFYSYTEKLMTSGFDLSPNNAAGLNLSIPIFSSGVRKANLSKARIELDKANRSKEMLSEQLQLQNNQLRYELANAYENYNTQKNNVLVAERVLSSIQNKYKQGLVSSLDLTQANTNYLQAESNYLNSAIDLMQSNLKLEKLYNNL